MSKTKTEVALVSLPTLPAELEQAFINDVYIDGLIKEIRQKASSEVGDIKTTKGRAVYISMAAKVRSAKVMIDDAGKALVAEMKARPALVDASRRKVREALDALANEIRKPVTDWEEEQAQIKADKEAEEARKWQEAEAKREAEIAAQKKESDHEVALLLNEKHDRDLADAIAAQERQRIENEERIRKEAAAQAIRDEQAQNQAALDAAARREAEAKADKEKAERDAREAQERENRLRQEAERARINAAAKAEQEKQEALAKAESDRLEAIETARREQDAAIQRERAAALAKENARLAEERRLADEALARAANVEHKRTINRAVITALIKDGIPEEFAQKCVIAIASGRVPKAVINY